MVTLEKKLEEQAKKKRLEERRRAMFENLEDVSGTVERRQASETGTIEDARTASWVLSPHRERDRVDTAAWLLSAHGSRDKFKSYEGFKSAAGSHVRDKVIVSLILVAAGIICAFVGATYLAGAFGLGLFYYLIPGEHEITRKALEEYMKQVADARKTQEREKPTSEDEKRRLEIKKLRMETGG